jgi:hypothetical protein
MPPLVPIVALARYGMPVPPKTDIDASLEIIQEGLMNGDVEKKCTLLSAPLSPTTPAASHAAMQRRAQS